MIGTREKRRRRAALSLLAVCALAACSGGSVRRPYGPSVDAIGRNHFEAYLLYRAMSGATGQDAEAAFIGGVSEGASMPDAATPEEVIYAPLLECSFRPVQR